MIRCIVILALSAISLFGWNPDEQPNVNSRYTVESVHVAGKRGSRLSEGTRNELESVVGQKLDHSLLEKIASRIKKELRVEGVKIHVSKGTIPEQVSVEFAIEGGRRADFDLDVPKAAYHSRQGWTGGLESTTSIAGNDIGFGVISDGDALVERFSGVRGRFERSAPGNTRIRFRFTVESYHEQWNSSTLASSHFSPDLYRSRQNFQPEVTVVLAQPLTLTAGVSVERLDPQASGANTLSANAFTGRLAFHRRWEVGEANQEVDAVYSLRAASGLLNSDFGYTRNALNVNYRCVRGRSTVTLDFLGGRISGTAPLFEQFVLGNGGTLRGWNKYDLDPLGGSRVMHGSAAYAYRRFQTFYDTGAIWDRNTKPEAKHSAGVGYGRPGKDGFLLAVAFPLRGGHIDPIFIAGFNF